MVYKQSCDAKKGSAVKLTLQKKDYLTVCEFEVWGAPAPITVPATTVPATTVPATTKPVTTVPATTKPVTTVPPTTVPTLPAKPS